MTKKSEKATCFTSLNSLLACNKAKFGIAGYFCGACAIFAETKLGRLVNINMDFLKNKAPGFWQPAFALFGTIVGAGIFVLPYVISRAGIWPSIFLFAFIFALTLLLHLMYGEVILRTPGIHRLPGYAKIYLGKLWAGFAVFFEIVGGYGTLVVYIIMGGQFLFLIFGTALFGFGSFELSLLFWLAFSALSSFGLKAIGRFEVVLNVIFIGILGFLLFKGAPFFSFSNASYFGDPIFSILSYGVIMVALAGGTAIPEMRDMLRGNEQKLKRSVVLGTSMAAAITFLFGFGVAGMIGSDITENALQGLSSVLGGLAVRIGAVIGLIAVSTSYMILAVYLRDLNHYDFHWKKITSILAVVFVPALVFMLGLDSLAKALGFLGSITIAFSFLITIVLFKKSAKDGVRDPEYRLKLPAWLLGLVAFFLVLGGVVYVAFLAN